MNIVPFSYNDKDVRVIFDENDSPNWVAKDVCEILDLGSTHKVMERLDEDEKERSLIPTLGGKQEMWVINEPGLYNLILGSKKPEAKPFKKWVTHEVLPSIRKTGSYSVKPERPKVINISKELVAAVKMAKAFGFSGNQAILSANNVIKNVHKVDCLELMGQTALVCEKQEEHLTATEIGRRIGDLSGAKVNQILKKMGLIDSERNAKNKLIWHVTKKGKPHTVVKDTGKKSGGVPIQQIFYFESVLDLVRKYAY